MMCGWVGGRDGVRDSIPQAPAAGLHRHILHTSVRATPACISGPLWLPVLAQHGGVAVAVAVAWAAHAQ